MSFTWNREAAAASGHLVSAASVLAPLAAPAPTWSMQDVAGAEQRAKAGLLLSQLYGYLRDNAETHPHLAVAIPLLSSAIADYRAGLGPDPVAGVRAVYAAIEDVRRGDPAVPEP
ncbi:MAG TPA: hypothetical protein VGP36_03640 [Mycobacteriales bacterium]|jgi:hypothetical protein|nr:hypothetical protein [Mycobacteriales bacterium]